MTRSLGGMFLLWEDFCGWVSSKFPSPHVIADLIGVLVDEAMGNSKLVSLAIKDVVLSTGSTGFVSMFEINF
jgi:hypothetical protein